MTSGVTHGLRFASCSISWRISQSEDGLKGWNRCLVPFLPCHILSIGSTRYQGSQNAPRNVQMTTGDTIQWRSDYSVTSGGFTLCAYPNRLPDPPPSAPPSPPPPFPPFAANTMFTLVSFKRVRHTHGTPHTFPRRSPRLPSSPTTHALPPPTSPAHPSPS